VRVRERKRTGNDGVRKERASAHPLSLARGYTHIHTARALSLAHEVSLRNVRESTCNTHMHAHARARARE
jgi:hypothetical protein